MRKIHAKVILWIVPIALQIMTDIFLSGIIPVWLIVGMTIVVGIYIVAEYRDISLHNTSYAHLFFKLIDGGEKRGKKGIVIISGISLVIAICPPIMAFIEKNYFGYVCEESYPITNMLYNFAGASVLIILLFIIRSVRVVDLPMVNEFVIDTTSYLVPCCFFLVFSFQNLENSLGKEMDHDASFSNINQVLNCVWLVYVYYTVLLSTVILLSFCAYYKKTGQVPKNSKIVYILFILLNVFFYATAFNEYIHIKVLCYMFAPLVIVASVIWLSVYRQDKRRRIKNIVYTVLSSLIYLCVVVFSQKVFLSSKEHIIFAVALILISLITVVIVIKTMLNDSELKYDEAVNIVEHVIRDENKRQTVLERLAEYRNENGNVIDYDDYILLIDAKSIFGNKDDLLGTENTETAVIIPSLQEIRTIVKFSRRG